MDRRTDGPTDRRTDGPTDRPTGRQTDRQTQHWGSSVVVVRHLHEKRHRAFRVARTIGWSCRTRSGIVRKDVLAWGNATGTLMSRHMRCPSCIFQNLHQLTLSCKPSFPAAGEEFSTSSPPVVVPADEPTNKIDEPGLWQRPLQEKMICSKRDHLLVGRFA